MIKSEMSPCFDESQGIHSVQMHQHPMHALPEHHHHHPQQQQQQIMGSYGGTSANNAQSTNNEQIDIYRDLILRHLIQDIGSTCSKLCLPTSGFLFYHIKNTSLKLFLKHLC